MKHLVENLMTEDEAWEYFSTFSEEGMLKFKKTYIRVLDFFKGDVEKTKLWFNTKNPSLGHSIPMSMLKLGRYENLISFINTSVDEGMKYQPESSFKLVIGDEYKLDNRMYCKPRYKTDKVKLVETKIVLDEIQGPEIICSVMIPGVTINGKEFPVEVKALELSPLEPGRVLYEKEKHESV